MDTMVHKTHSVCRHQGYPSFPIFSNVLILKGLKLVNTYSIVSHSSHTYLYLLPAHLDAVAQVVDGSLPKGHFPPCSFSSCLVKHDVFTLSCLPVPMESMGHRLINV